MECLQNRVDSFSKPVRVQNASKTGAAKHLKWPHPPSFIAQPATLAEAGFYFDPSYDERDNVTCFVCGKELAGWEEQDDPFEIHWTKCAKECAWAVVRCGLRDEMDTSGRFTFSDKKRLPSSKAMEKARQQLYTIGDGWIHDQVRNHGASSKRLAKAGFVFTPQHPEDDLATCLYCSLSLDAWEASDDPMEEHRKRSPTCPFFVNTSLSASTAKPSSTSSAYRTSSRASTAPKKGRSQSNMPDIIEDIIEPLAPPAPSSTTGGRKASRSTRKPVAPVEETEEEEEEEEEEEPKKSRKPRSTTRSVSRKVSSRSIKRVESLQEEDEVEDELILTATTTKSITSKKSLRSRKTNTNALEEPGSEVEVVDPPAASKKSSLSNKSDIDEYATAPEENVEEEVVEEEEARVKPPPRKSTKPSRALKSKQNLTPMDDEEGSDQKDEGDDEEEEVKTKTQPRKPTKPSRTAKSKQKVAQMEGKDSERQGEVKPRSRKSTKPSGETKSNQKLKRMEDDEGLEQKDGEDEEEEKKERTKAPPRKSTKPSRAAKSKQKETQFGDEEDSEHQALGKSTLSKKPSRQKPAAPPALVEEDDDDDDDDDDTLDIKLKVLPPTKNSSSRSTKTKKPIISNDTEEEEEGDLKPATTETGDELEQLVIPKKTAKPKNPHVKDPQTSSQDFSQRGSVIEVALEGGSKPEIKSILSAKAKGKTKDMKSGDEDDVKDVSSVPVPPSDIPKNHSKPFIHESEQSDSDVEMEDATMVLKMLKKKSVSMERLRLPSPPPPPLPVQEPEGVGSEEEVQADLEQVDLDADMDMDAAEAKPLVHGLQSLLEVSRAQKQFEPPHHQHHPAVNNDDDDHARSFAPRLVVKSVEEQRSRTPDLVPIRTSSERIILGGSRIAFSREDSKPVVPAEQLTTPPRKVVFESIGSTAVPSPATTTATSSSINISGASKDNNETKTDQSSHLSSEENPGTEESESISQFTPCLSKLPFVALHVLSDAELDMTVEEWIRYQIEVEYDKFKRDGERELGRFRKRAEDVRKVIEGL